MGTKTVKSRYQTIRSFPTAIFWWVELPSVKALLGERDTDVQIDDEDKAKRVMPITQRPPVMAHAV